MSNKLAHTAFVVGRTGKKEEKTLTVFVKVSIWLESGEIGLRALAIIYNHSNEIDMIR